MAGWTISSRAMEASIDWLEMVPPGEALAASHPPLGRVDLPTASYTEMMEWVLPTPVRQKFHALLEEFAGRPDVRRFLRGGFWRGFFSKYAEVESAAQENAARLIQAATAAAQNGAQKSGQGSSCTRAKAITHLLRAQCNDAYWHGIFGGLYAPHLRTELWRELVRAETIADALRHGAEAYQLMTRLDFDADGREEIEITSPQFAALVKPSDGGTLEVLDFRPSAVTLINSLQRRVEAYHSRLQNADPVQPGKVASIHDQTLAKEPGLEKQLKYDRWPRNTFRLLLFANGENARRLRGAAPGGERSFAGGDYRIEQARRRRKLN